MLSDQFKELMGKELGFEEKAPTGVSPSNESGRGDKEEKGTKK